MSLGDTYYIDFDIYSSSKSNVSDYPDSDAVYIGNYRYLIPYCDNPVALNALIPSINSPSDVTSRIGLKITTNGLLNTNYDNLISIFNKLEYLSGIISPNTTINNLTNYPNSFNTFRNVFGNLRFDSFNNIENAKKLVAKYNYSIHTINNIIYPYRNYGNRSYSLDIMGTGRSIAYFCSAFNYYNGYMSYFGGLSLSYTNLNTSGIPDTFIYLVPYTNLDGEIYIARYGSYSDVTDIRDWITTIIEGPYIIQTDISDAQVIIESDYFFTGNPIIPTSVSVYLDGTQLERDVDYTVDITNNIYVGEANVNIAGIGNYTGTKQAHFTIARANIANANISVDGTSFPYTGQEIEPTVTITMGGYTAQRTVDYVLRYSDNVNIGTGSIQIDTGPAIELGTGNFQGTATITFQITGNDSPYEPGGTTEPEIGPTDGDWDLINNPLDLSYTNHNDLSLGLFRAYAMDKTQLSNFGKTLWRPSILQSITALLSNPLNTIISLGSYPFTINAASASETIEFNWIDDWIPDGWQFAPTGHPLNGEYQTFSFGTVAIPRYSGTFYDFQPYTQAQIYIPYIGYVNVKANEIIGKQIELQYHVNLITGDFTAIVFLSNRLAPQIIGEYQGNMLRELPLSMSTFVNFVGTAIKTTAIAGAAVAAFGAAAPLAATAGESAKNSFEDSLMQSDTNNQSNQSNQIEKTSSKIAKRDVRRAGIAVGASAIGLITSANQPIPRNGTIGAVSGRTSTQEAFVSLSLPHQNIPSNQAMLGYPTNLPGPLSKFSGYTVVRDIHIKSSTALYSELIEIEKVVRGGIVI